MAQVDLEVGGRRYEVACRDGGEGRLRSLAAVVDAKVAEATRAVGHVGEGRQLLLAALLLADALDEAETLRDAAAAEDRAGIAEIERYAARLEALADGLEKLASGA